MSDPILRKRAWIFVIATLVVVIFLIWLSKGHFGMPVFPLSAKSIIAFVVAIAVLAGTWVAIFQRTGKMAVEYVIAFDITVFVVIGLALLVSASVRWQAGCLTAGAALLGGGFFGFIFGMPLSAASAPDQNEIDANASQALAEARKATIVAQRSSNDQDIAAAQQAQAIAQKAMAKTGRIAKHSLLADAASTLSKLVAGATLVQIAPIYREFKTASAYISTYLLQDSTANNATLGGAVLLYFIFLGFLAGLFLPAYFMEGLFSGE